MENSTRKSTNKKTTKKEKNTDESLISEDSQSDRIWTDGFILLVHIILPIAITGVILGRKTIFSKLLNHLDKSCLSVFYPSFSKQEKLKKWLSNYLPYIDGGIMALWKDGSLMCTLINSVVPGACPNPHRHWKKPPTHGQAIAYKYLGVTPLFTERDFLQNKLNSAMENLLTEYMLTLQSAIDKIAPRDDITFSTRYVARGMGLITGEQHRKTIIYVYANFKGQMDDLLVHVRGPYNTYGSAILYARDFLKNDNHSTNKKTQTNHQKSFLKTLSSDFTSLLKPKDRGPACDIEIRTEFEKDRAKVIFIPNNSGVYEICLTTNGEHIAGSPYNLTIEKNRSGVTDGLHDEEIKSANVRNTKKKVLNTVIYYEKLKKKENHRKVSNEDLVDDKCNISLNESRNLEETTNSIENNPIENNDFETLNKLNNSTTMQEKVDKLKYKVQQIEIPTVDNITNDEKPIEANIINSSLETLNELNNILDRHLKSNDKDVNQSEVEEEIELNNEIHEIIETQQNTDVELLSSHLNEIDNPHLIECKYPEEVMSLTGETNLLEVYPTHDDSGTYDIDPDSLASSIEMENSPETMTSSTNSGASFASSEVNNNDIMVKSSDDICYLILDQPNQERVYSKDFVSCKDDKSKEDLSKSESDLLATNNNNFSNVSALSQDNVQEAHNTRNNRSSRIFRHHPQEGHMRYHSFSYNNLSYNLEKSNPEEEEGYEFKQHFLRRKAFWTNISMSNTNLHNDSELKHKIHKSTEKINQNSNNEVIEPKYGMSKSLDFITHEKRIQPDKEEKYENYDSVDSMSYEFSSIRNRKSEFYKQQQNSYLERQELYAVRGEKYSWSIHDKIKCFESTTNNMQTSSVSKPDTLQENITVKNKIKERFEKAHMFFKGLEDNTDSGALLARRYSLDADVNLSLVDKISNLKERVNKIELRTSKRGIRTHQTINNISKINSVNSNNEIDSQFIKERKKKRTTRPTIENVFI